MDFAEKIADRIGALYFRQIEMGQVEKRKHKRLAVKLGLTCSDISSLVEKNHTGQTVNVSPGGMFFETTSEGIKAGGLLKVKLQIPPTEGLLEFGGRISSIAKVKRTINICETPYCQKQGVALEFCDHPKLLG